MSFLMYDMNTFDKRLMWAYIMLTDWKWQYFALPPPQFYSSLHSLAKMNSHVSFTLICLITTNCTLILRFTVVALLLSLPDKINIHLSCYTENEDKRNRKSELMSAGTCFWKMRIRVALIVIIKQFRLEIYLRFSNCHLFDPFFFIPSFAVWLGFQSVSECYKVYI